MLNKQEDSQLNKFIILKSLKWPFLFLSAAILLISLRFLKLFRFISSWQTWGYLLDEASLIFLEIAFVGFFYNLVIYSCKFYEIKYQNFSLATTMIVRSLRKSAKGVFFIILLCLIIEMSLRRYFTIFNNANLVTISIILSVGWVAIKMLYASEAILYKKMQSYEFEKKIQIYPLYTKMHIIKNIGVIIVSIITFAALLMSFSHIRQFGISLLASAGVITAIIGFSGQKTFSSIISGLQMAFSQPIKIGDAIFMDHNWGIVEEISFTYVHLRMKDRRRMIVPINFFLDHKFENWTSEGNSLTTSIHFKVDYMMPLAPLREELEHILQKSAIWDGKTRNLLINKLDETSVEIRVQISTNQAEKLSLFRAEVREGFLKFMRDNYPQFLPRTRQIGIPNSIKPSTEESKPGPQQ